MGWRSAWVAGVRPTPARDLAAAISAATAVGAVAGLGAAAGMARLNPSLRDPGDATLVLLATAATYGVLALAPGLLGLALVRWVGFRPRAEPASTGEDAPAPKSRFPFTTHALILLSGLAGYALTVHLAVRLSGRAESDPQLLAVAGGAALACIAAAALVVTRRLFQGLVGPRRWLVPMVLLFTGGLMLLVGLGGAEAEQAEHGQASAVLGGDAGQRAGADPVLEALAAPLPRRVLVIALDGADWRRIDRLMAAGELPSFRRLAESGVRASLSGERPAWPTVSWTTVATGVPPSVHGVCDVTEVHLPGLNRGLQRVYAKSGVEPLVPLGLGLRPLLDRLLDAPLSEERLVGTSQRRAKAVWNVLAERGLQVAVVRWPASFPAEALEGWVVANDDPWSGELTIQEAWDPAGPRPELVWPRELRTELADLIDRARDGRDFALDRVGPRPGPGADGQTDDRPGPRPLPPLPIFARLSEQERLELEAEPRLHEEARLVLSADFFAAAASLHLWREHRPHLLAVCLRGIDVLGHRLGRFPGAIDGAYRWVDQALGAWLSVAGADTTVVVLSAYGWDYEPGPSGDPGGHADAPDGVLLLAGAGVRPAAELVPPPSIHDVAPTLLALFGLPPSAEMPGRPLLEALQLETGPAPAERPRSYGRYALRSELPAPEEADGPAAAPDPAPADPSAEPPAGEVVPGSMAEPAGG